MRPYSRPFLQSSRVRHFAAGIGAALFLVALTAASTVGIAPMDGPEGIMDLTIDVEDVPCDEPFDENDRVVVDPDTVLGQIRMRVVVRNRNCCCCESGGSNLGLLRGSGGSVTPQRPTDRSPAVVAPTAVTPPLPVEPSQPASPRELSPLAARPGTRPGLGQPQDVSSVTQAARRAGPPWWLALAAAPAVLLFGRDTGVACEDDETGTHSGPSRTC